MLPAVCVLLFSSVLFVPSLVLAREEAEPRFELGGAALVHADRMADDLVLSGGGFVRGGARLSALALSLEANAEVGSHWGETMARLGGYAAAAWVHGRLRVGGGLGAAHRSLEATDIDYQFLAKTLTVGPMAEASIDFVHADNFDGYVGARLRLDIATTGIPQGTLVPGGQLWIGFRIRP